MPDKHAGLEFPFDSAPNQRSSVYVADSIRWIRHSLPFALDHVNCWLLGDSDNQVLIDTGISSGKTRGDWQSLFPDSASTPGVPAVDSLLVTHFHPDHMGLAGWFHSGGAKLLGSTIESDYSREIWAVDDPAYEDFYAHWYRSNGLPESRVNAVRGRGNSYRKIVHTPPPAIAWECVKEGNILALGGQEYRVLIGRGHAPDMIMLYRESDRVLIAADQVLPSITPNVSVMPRLADKNPLAGFLDTLRTLKALPEDTLVLPSHGSPFRGLWARLDALSAHHDLRLDEVLEACSTPTTAYDLFPVLFRPELDDQQMSFALGESLAHLHYLESNGNLTRSDENGVTQFIRA